MKQLEKLELEADIGPEIKRCLFINGLNEELQMYLWLEQQRTYNEALRKARVKDLVKKNNTDLQLLAYIMKKLNEIKSNQQAKETIEVNAV